MKFKISLFCLCIVSSCLKQSSINIAKMNNDFNLKSGLRIENGINRGLAFTDSLHDKYAITYISVTITNDSTIPIHLNTNFELEYEHPLKESDEKFRIVILPEEWTYDGLEITDNMIFKIHYDKGKTNFKKTLKPNQKYVFAIGTLRPSPAKICGIIPNAFLANEINANFKECQWQRREPYLSNSEMELGLKLDYCHIDGNATNCRILFCGQISYPKN